MAQDIKKLAEMIEEERNYVYDALLSKSPAFTGIGEEHIDVESDEQCKGALKAFEYVIKLINEDGPKSTDKKGQTTTTDKTTG